LGTAGRKGRQQTNQTYGHRATSRLYRSETAAVQAHLSVSDRTLCGQSGAAAFGRRFTGMHLSRPRGGLQCRLLTLRDVGSRVSESGVETSAVRSQLFNVGFGPFACKDAIKQQPGMVCIMLNDIQGMCGKH
jgi:hypothetical protein